MGRVISATYCIPTDCSYGTKVSAQYNLAGDMVSMTYPDGRVVTQSYDEARHLTGIQYSSWNGQPVNQSYYSASTFSPGGQTTGAILGNGVHISASYNSRQNIAALSYATANQTLWSKQYVWASNGKNLLQIADLLNSAQTYSYTYDPDNRLATANGGGQTLVSPAVAATGSVSITGTTDGVYSARTCSGLPGQPLRCTTTTYYDYGVVNLSVGSSTETTNYSQYSTPSSIATALATAVNQDASCPATASASGSTVNLTSKLAGSAYDYSLSASSATNDTQYFTQASFGTSTSGSTLTGGTNAVYSGADQLAESYSTDPWGNQQSSGNFSFMQTFTANNQVSGYGYDAAGNQTQDRLGNTYTYDALGQETASNSATFVYDALGQRVQKSGGSYPSEVIYFNGLPIARYDTSAGVWTDLIRAGSSIIAEVQGNQSAVPTYRLLDHEGTLVATTDGAGGVTGTSLTTPYGQVMASNTADPYLYTGLPQDTENFTDDAQYRNYSTEQTRWLRPDPYNGSYDLYNPQSFNRYVYVNGNPLGNVDPSGLVDGWATGIGGAPCTAIHNAYDTSILTPGGFNYCDPVASALSELFAPIADKMVQGVNSIFGTSYSTNVTAGQIVPYIAAAITIACSIDNNTAACGPSGLTSLIPGAGGDVGKGVGDGLAVASAVVGSMCLAGAVANPVCDAFIAYNVANALYSFFNNLFNGPAQFTGSLLPRPSDLGGLGTAPIGIPNQNLTIKSILGQQSGGAIPSPGMHVQ